MATSSSKTLDHWRKVFREAGESDVFHVIRQAIHVAASRHLDEFRRRRRDKIVEMLFAALPGVEKADEGRGNADVEAIEVKAIEEKKDDGRDNAVKAIEVKVNEEKEESGRGNPVKSDGALFAARTPLSAEQEPPPAAVAVVEEKAETKKQETWKVSVSENGKIRLRRVLHDQTRASKPETLTFTENHPGPLNQEGSLPTFTEHHPEARNDEEGSLRSNLEAVKRKLREGYQPFEPTPKKFCRRPLQFRISGARLR